MPHVRLHHQISKKKFDSPIQKPQLSKLDSTKGKGFSTGTQLLQLLNLELVSSLIKMCIKAMPEQPSCHTGADPMWKLYQWFLHV